MDLLKWIISWSHIISATISIITGAIVIFSKKGHLLHKKMGVVYFYAMLVNNIFALFIYNARGKMFFPHWLAIIILVTIIPGYFVTRYKQFRYWLPIHIFCQIFSYYLLIGGAVNEVFLHIPKLRPLIINGSPTIGITHFFVMIIFIIMLVYFLIKYRRKNK